MRHCYSVLLLIVASATVINCLDLECYDSQDCGAGSCCVLGMQPHSLPFCSALGAEGSSCRPFNQPFNTTVTYPNGESANLTNIYSLYCTCSEGLECHLETNTCA
ncbi:Astakine [Blattella germanica]|nr:Astakine [Blattella germanica]